MVIGAANWENERVLRVHRHARAFTLIELLVVLAVLFLLLSVLMPSLRKAKCYARNVINTSYQKQLVNGVSMYGVDNSERLPETVATNGFGTMWTWAEPTRLVGDVKRTLSCQRSMGAYLRDYLPQAEVISCVNVPQQYRYLQQAWDADEWDNPETPMPFDSVGGTLCYLWNYVGVLPEGKGQFRGAKKLANSGRFSNVLVSHYLGYDHWRSPKAFGSCEKLPNSSVVDETWLQPAYWASCWTIQAEQDDLCTLDVKINAGYLDGHVRVCTTDELVPMKVALDQKATEAYPDGFGPGTFYVPAD